MDRSTTLAPLSKLPLFTSANQSMPLLPLWLLTRPSTAIDITQSSVSTGRFDEMGGQNRFSGLHRAQLACETCRDLDRHLVEMMAMFG